MALDVSAEGDLGVEDGVAEVDFGDVAAEEGDADTGWGAGDVPLLEGVVGTAAAAVEEGEETGE